MRRLFLPFCCVFLFAALALYAEQPAQNISAATHPNLARAQTDMNMAYQKILDAQKANENDLGGHAEKAKELLNQASEELKQAALAANKTPNDPDKPNVNRPEDAPEPNVSASKHPNIAKAQAFIERAYQSVIAAQKANEYDMGGHAAKAKTLLEQAISELKLAAQSAGDKK
jgi:hypothetical protein